MSGPGTREGISWRADFGCWWPDYDHKPEVCHAMASKSAGHVDFAIRHARGRKLALQAGGHAGLWPLRLARSFKRVLTFEPEPALFACLERNCAGAANIEAHRLALSDAAGEARMRPHVSAGSWRIDAEGSFPIQASTIDSLALPALDALFLDIEGHEVAALAGAAASIARWRPVIHVEELPRSRDAIADHLRGLSYRKAATIGRDGVWLPQ